MPVMVHHQCFRGIDCYSSLQKLFAIPFENDPRLHVSRQGLTKRISEWFQDLFPLFTFVRETYERRVDGFFALWLRNLGRRWWR